MKWLLVPKYRVEVTKLGQIRNSKSKKRIKSWIHKGYKLVCVKNLVLNKWVTKGVHQLVALAFIGPCPPKHEVNHKDLNKQNNHYKNLEYLTRKRNIRHALANGVLFGGRGPCKSKQGENNGRAKLSNKETDKIRKLYATGRYTQREIGIKYNVSNVRISKIVSRT